MNRDSCRNDVAKRIQQKIRPSPTYLLQIFGGGERFLSISSPLIKGLFTYLYFASTAPTAAKRRQSASVCCIVLRHPSELHRPTSICHASISVMTEDCWRLDPTRFPQRIDLELSGALMDDLERLSASTGRPVRDLAADLLSQAIADQGQTTPDLRIACPSRRPPRPLARGRSSYRREAQRTGKTFTTPRSSPQPARHTLAG